MTDAKIRTEPRLTVSKLAEYIEANPLRQRSLLVDQKYPSTFIAARYTPAENLIKKFLTSNPINVDILSDGLDAINAAPATTEWESDQNKLCAEAVESFIDVVEEILDMGLVFSSGDNNVPKMPLSGVEISVRPELLARDQEKKCFGAVKIYFSKTYPLKADGSGLYASTAVYQWLLNHMSPPDGFTHSHKHTFVVDVFAKTIHRTPAAYKSRMKHLDAACKTISALWPTLTK